MASAREKPSRQRALTILKPLRSDRERKDLEVFLRAQGDELHPERRSGLRAAFDAINGLHYLSWFVIDGLRPAPTPEIRDPAAGPPVLVLEANFDGSEQEFLRLLANHPLLKVSLDETYGFCDGYPASGSPEEKAQWLALGNKPPEVFYVARPGQGTDRLEKEKQLAADVEKAVSELGEPRGRRIEHLRRIWDRLTPEQREQVQNPPVKPFWVRNSLRSHPLKALLALVALLALGGAFTLVLIGLHAWGLPLWPWLVPPDRVLEATRIAALVLGALAGAGIGAWLLFHLLEAPKDIAPLKRISIWIRKFLQMIWATLKALPAVFALLGVVAFLSWQWKLLLCLAGITLIGLLLLALLLLFLLVLIAMAELVDEVDGMRWDKAKLTPIKERREDLFGQNHFVSVTPVKKGLLRQVALRTVLFAVNNLARILYDPRGLAGIPSIHFARWQTLDGGRRLLFATNYDGGWGGYLGDFVAIAAFGMNAIWGSSGGFPRTFYLFFSGVKDEQRFKCYARNSQFESLLWYQRYPQLSLAAIRRNSELLDELAHLSAYLEPPSRLSAYLDPDVDMVNESELDQFLRRFAIPGRLDGNS